MFRFIFCFGGKGCRSYPYQIQLSSVSKPCEVRSTSTQILPPRRPSGSTGCIQIRSNSPRIQRKNNNWYFSSAQRQSGNPVSHRFPIHLRVGMRNSNKPPFSKVIYTDCRTKSTLDDRVLIGYTKYPTHRSPLNHRLSSNSMDFQACNKHPYNHTHTQK